MLVCTRDQSFVEMDFPTTPLQPVPAEISRDQVAQALSIEASSIISMHWTLWTDILVHVDPSTFTSVKPDFQKINAIEAKYVDLPL